MPFTTRDADLSQSSINCAGAPMVAGIHELQFETEEYTMLQQELLLHIIYLFFFRSGHDALAYHQGMSFTTRDANYDHGNFLLGYSYSKPTSISTAVYLSLSLSFR